MVSVFTPTYNRASTLHRVFESLQSQTYTDLEWVVVDDGSTDNTAQVIQSYKEQASFPVVYYAQPNGGKHTAVNQGLSLARGEMFAIIDSDDSFVPEALQVLVDAWNAIDPQQRKEFKGVTCRMYDPGTNRPLGKPFPQDPLDTDELNIRFRYKYQVDTWGIMSTEVMRRYPFPVEKGLRFYPEAIIYNTMAREFKTRYINAPLAAYYMDQIDANTSKTTSRAKENVYLWRHYLNDVMDHFIYDPAFFCKAAVGFSRDGILSGSKRSVLLATINSSSARWLCAILWPVGAYLACRKAAALRRDR